MGTDFEKKLKERAVS
ncbi:hypothetical protein ACSQES_005381, partial [Escherichia coli]